MDWLRSIAPTIASALGGPLTCQFKDDKCKAIEIEPTDVNKIIADGKLPFEIHA